MTRCPACQKEITEQSASCPWCSFAFDVATQRLESTPSPASKEPASEPRTPVSFDSIDDARFVPGTILAGRYRIVGLLGRGGMGEVYRADDLKLSQPVALKFLPDHLLSDGAALARFHREVRVARHVSHKNVCRVYDIGEVDGRHFLSMEFIKGEELSSLVRRIGRLPSDKAVQLARQICAGLAAAHETGILHRDLKPANVMIDGDGNARILDFGLAGLTEELADDEVHAGTPAYMAPEQFDGESATIRSDIYSLGLVLYELFTGKRAFEGVNLGELVKLRRSDTTPTNPTSIVKDLDPVIEKVIDRCIQKDPAQRPASALQVAAALPGGDPIAAALAAGETPSPEMVAAAPREGALRPAFAISLLASVIVGLAVIVLLADKYVLYGWVPLDKSPDVLRENARDIIGKSGAFAPPTDYMEGFEYSLALLEYIARTDRRPNRWHDLKDGQPAPIVYWYRQSPDYLSDFDYFRDRWINPPPIVSGMAGVKLDTRGRLLSFYAVPPQIDPASSQQTINSSAAEGSELETRIQKLETDLWSPFFTAAGLDLTNFKPTTSQWAPLYMNDTRAAWEGVYPEQSTIPIRVEAASYRGKPVAFAIVNPWDKPERQDPFHLASQFTELLTLLIGVFVLVLIGSVLLAIRNLRLGRGDRKSALRLAIFVFTITELSRLFSAHHVPSFGEFPTLLNGLQDSVFAAGFIWVVYVALEPFVRRRWPDRIISWTRMLAGDFRDPLVGRDALIGAVFGVGISVWQIFVFFARGWLRDPALRPAMEPASLNLGMSKFVEALANQVSTPLLNAFGLLFVVLLLALLFKRDWLGFIVAWLVFAAVLAFLWGGALANWVSAGVTAGLIIFVLFRYGLLAMILAIFFLHMYIQFPVTTRFTSWYALGFVVDLVILLVLAFYAFRVSLAGQPLFGRRLLEE